MELHTFYKNFVLILYVILFAIVEISVEHLVEQQGSAFCESAEKYLKPNCRRLCRILPRQESLIFYLVTAFNLSLASPFSAEKRLFPCSCWAQNNRRMSCL
jgi:hypothetical protein